MPTLLTLPGADNRCWAKSCSACPIYKTRNRLGGPVGTEQCSKKTSVLFVAEAPGESEDDVGRPLIGRSGQILRRLIRILHGSEKGVAYSNAVRCRPIAKDAGGKFRNAAVPPAALEACQPNILRDIHYLDPEVIVLCGASAAASLAKQREGEKLVPLAAGRSVFDTIGQPFFVEVHDKQYRAIATYHPASVARNPASGGVLQSDVAKAFIWAKTDRSQRGKPAVILNTVKKVQQFLRHLKEDLTPKHVVMFDYETYHPSKYVVRLGMEVLTLSFSYNGDRGYVIPFAHPESPFTAKEGKIVHKLVRDFFRDPNVSFSSLAAHNAKYEFSVTRDVFRTEIAIPVEDTMLRAHALNENRTSKQVNEPFSLKTLVVDWLGFTGYSDRDIAPVVQRVKSGDTRHVKLGPLAEYNAMDCYVGNRLYDFEDDLADMEGYREKLKILGQRLHSPISSFASWMEQNGVQANKEKIRELCASTSPIISRIKGLEDELKGFPSVQKANRILLGLRPTTRGMVSPWKQQKVPWAFSVSAPAARRILFFDVMRLHRDEKGGLVWNHLTPKYKKLHLPDDQVQPEHLSVNKDLYNLFDGVPEVDKVAEWSLLAKVRSTYLDPIYKMLQDHPDMRDGRIRGSFHFHTTRTSRSSSSDPNMQNVPKGKTASARLVKGTYCVADGNVMICADYSQAEVRGLAHLTQDPNLLRAYEAAHKIEEICRNDPTPKNLGRLALEGDFHRQTASQIFSTPPAKVTKSQRDFSKTIVFGLIYGMSEFGLSLRLGISVSEARKYMKKFFAQFPVAAKWLDKMEALGFQNGYVESPIGRRRHLLSSFLIDPTDKGTWGQERNWKRYEDRASRNSPIQSLASDMNFIACSHLHQHIAKRKLPWRVINVVHDSIMAEVPFDDAGAYVELAQAEMTDQDLLRAFGVHLEVPLKADFTVGLTWGDQLSIAPAPVYLVHCRSCGAERKQTGKLKNKRCEECGKKDVRVTAQDGPLPFLIHTLKRRAGRKRKRA